MEVGAVILVLAPDPDPPPTRSQNPDPENPGTVKHRPVTYVPILVNMISEEQLEGIPSNLVQSFSCTRRRLDQNLVVEGEMSRSL